MNIPSHHPGINPAQLPLESLAGNPNISDQEKIGEVARQFEAVLLRQILQQARKPSPAATSPDNLSSDVYSDMVNQQLADSISRSGAFGLAKSLQSQLARQVLPHGGTQNPAANKSAPAQKVAGQISPRSAAHLAGEARETLSHDRKH
jgi:peptidoglycan hydrolase FlgJ